MDKIKVQIFGIENQIVDSGCRASGGCGDCGVRNHSCNGCGKGDSKSESAKQNKDETMLNTFKEIAGFIRSSDVGGNTCLEFIDMGKIGDIHPYNDIIELKDRGFDLPITVIDGIVRYYGGLSSKLIYKDIKELLE